MWRFRSISLTCQLGISHQQFGELSSTRGRERPLGVMTALLLSEKLLEGTPTQDHVHVLVAWDNVALEMSQPDLSDPMPMPFGRQFAAGGTPQVEVFMTEAEEPQVQHHRNS